VVFEYEPDNLLENLSSSLPVLVVVVVAEDIEGWGVKEGGNGAQRWGLDDLNVSQMRLETTGERRTYGCKELIIIIVVVVMMVVGWGQGIVVGSLHVRDHICNSIDRDNIQRK
jgi:hypothetical protein